MNKKAQVAIEFIILLFMSVFIILTIMISVKSVSDKKVSNNVVNELDDLGKSLQQEFLLASQLEDGYVREIYIPYQLYAKEYSLNLSTVSSTFVYLDLYYEDINLFYGLPSVQGQIKKGHNTISKQNGIITIIQ